MEAIVLAAGYSSRAQTFKMTIMLGNMTVLEHTLSKFEGICHKIIVVSGFQSERINKLLSEIRYKYKMEIVGVVNPLYDLGMFSSVQKGCKEVEASSFFITPGDCPLVDKETIHKLTTEKGNVVIPSYHRKGGHPIKLSGDIKQRILEADSDTNLRSILQKNEKNFLNVEDPGVVMDLDTPEDIERATEYYNHRGCCSDESKGY